MKGQNRRICLSVCIAANILLQVVCITQSVQSKVLFMVNVKICTRSQKVRKERRSRQQQCFEHCQ